MMATLSIYLQAEKAKVQMPKDYSMNDGSFITAVTDALHKLGVDRQA